MKSLVLIVGTNPLPNLVVAKYLLSSKKDEYSNICLIYSEKNNRQQGTKEYAENLKELLSKEYPNLKFNLISLSDVSSAKNITNDLSNSKLDKNAEYHLNYTGGTKTMSVHIHEYFKENFQNITFSYLDARYYRLIYDNNTYEPIQDDLKKYVRTSINDLLKLHGYDLKRGSFENKTFDKVLNEFNNAIKKNYKDFINWYANVRSMKSECPLDNIKKFKEKITTRIPY